MLRNRLYTKDEVLQAFETALGALKETGAPSVEPEHLATKISRSVNLATKISRSVNLDKAFFNAS